MTSFDDFMTKLNAESNISTQFLLKYWDAVSTDNFEDLLIELFNSEDNINTVIQALKLKLLLIQSKSSSYCEININKFLLTYISESNISGTHDFILHSMLIQPSTNRTQLLENTLIILKSNDKNNKIILRQLEILNVVMDVSIILNIPLINSYDNENEILYLIISLICSEEKDVQRKTLLDIVPKYIACTKKYELFSNLWIKVKASETVMFIIIALEQFYLLDFLSKSFDLFAEIDYWNILQSNLNSEDPVLKKQAIYLLKKSVELIISKKSAEKYNITKICCETNSSIIEHYDDAWKNFFILCDVSNEKQLHLIEPTLKLYDTLKYLDVSWQMCISKLFIRHPHSAIVKYTVYEILASNWLCDVNTLVHGLNNVFLYESISTNPITELLGKYVTKLNSKEFIQFINNFCNIQPSPIPFFNICKALEMTKDAKCNCHCLYTLISCSEKVPHIFLRKGIQHCLFNSFYIMIKNHDIARENVLEEIVKFIYIFYKNGYLSFTNKYARNIVNILVKGKIKTGFTLQKLLFLPERYSTFFAFVLAEDLFDSETFKKNKELFWTETINKINIENKLKGLLLLCNIIKAVTYFNKNKFILSAEDIKFILQEILYICDNVKPEVVNTDFFTKILLLLDVLLVHRNEDTIELYNQCLIFLSELQNKKKYISHIIFTEKIIDIMADISESYSETLKLNLKNSKQNYKQELSNVINKSVLIRKIMSSYYKAHLKLMKNSSIGISRDKLVNKIIKYYDKGDIDVILIVLNTLNDIVQEIKIMKEINHLDLLNLLRRLEKDIFSLQSNELFRPSVLKYIEITAKLKNINNPSLNEFINKFYSKMFDTSQTIYGIRNKILNENKLNLQHSEFVESLLHGPILRKNKRIEFDTCAYISSEISEQDIIFYEENPYVEDAKVTSTAVYILLNHLSYNQDSLEFCNSVWDILKSKYLEITVDRYYAGSFIHIRKLRILQSLHLLLPFINIDLLDDAKKWLFEALVTRSPQPSIKLLLQWILVRIYIRLENIPETIMHLVDKAKYLSGANLTYILPIIYHLVKEAKVDTAIIEQCFELLLIFTMGQQFSIRYIAQITFKSIYENCTLDTNIRSKYAVIYNTIIEVIKQTKVQKSVDDIISFVSLPLSIETIYYEIPRLTNVSHTKWLPIEYFEEMPSIELRCNTSLKEIQIKSSCSISHNQTEAGNSNVQRKIDTSSTNDFINDCSNSNAITSGLVVVASLIDRAPNLGGLNRTCEVFGVKEYVLNNFQLTKNKEYQSLSMSSENWTQITEIKFDNLCSYLMLMKSRGYRITGAEQTVNSTKLDSYKFEKQTVLLLGNEKEGIPANLIHILDDCIEIPQFGQIRSLNVHVAGSLFIWEYAKQHCTQRLQ